MSVTFKQQEINARLRFNELQNHHHDEKYVGVDFYSGRNILINANLNSEFVVNQRAFGGTWVVGDYGYDRWKGKAGGLIEQPIEEGNYKPDSVYTLSVDNEIPVQVKSPSSGTWDLDIDILETTLQIQLELGHIVTEFEFVNSALQLLRCQRYYQLLTGVGVFEPIGEFAVTTTTLLRCTKNLQVMRVSIPVLFVSTATIERLGGSAGTLTASSLAINANSDLTSGLLLLTADGSSFVIGESINIRKNNDVTKIALDAEL